MSSAMTKTAGFTRMMRHTATAVVLAVIAAATLLQRPAAQAQGGALLGRVGRGSPEDAFVSSDKDTRSYNKRDFNGLWARNPQAYGLPPCAECGDPGPWPGYGYHGTPPPRTPEGEKRFQANKPSRGIELGSPEASKRTDLDIGMRRAVLPAFGNDPEMRCEPLGLPRLITFSGGGATMEMIHTPSNDRIIQRFEWTWDNREIWLDGRRIPNVDDYLPRFTGYSTARWEGDTLVVTSTGFDERAWLDQYGYPISEKAVSGRAVGSSFAESAPRPDNPHRPTSLYASVAEQSEGVDADSQGEDGGQRLVRHPGRPLCPERRVAVQYVPRSRSRNSG